VGRRWSAHFRDVHPQRRLTAAGRDSLSLYKTLSVGLCALLAESNPGSGLTFKVKSPHNHISYAMLTEALLRDFTARRYKPLPTVAQMFQSIYDALAQT
jgi:hypothetical protein